MRKKGPTALLVEDDPSDVMLMEDALKGHEAKIDLKTASDGEPKGTWQINFRGCEDPRVIEADVEPRGK